MLLISFQSGKKKMWEGSSFKVVLVYMYYVVFYTTLLYQISTNLKKSTPWRGRLFFFPSFLHLYVWISDTQIVLKIQSMIQESRFRFLLILCILVSVLIKGASIDKCFVTFGFSVIGSHYQTTMTDEDTIRKKKSRTLYCLAAGRWRFI